MMSAREITAPQCTGPLIPISRAIAQPQTIELDETRIMPPVPVGDGVSAKARQVALSRHALVGAWEAYRVAHARDGAARVDAEFLAGYNAGVIYKHIHTILGEVSRQTLYRWRAALEGTDDWGRLVPQYGRSATPRLTSAEERIFLGLLLTPNKMSIAKAATFTKLQLRNQGIQCTKSDMTFRRYAEEFIARKYDTWIFMREGQKALKDKVLPYIKRDPSKLEVGDVFVADGHVLNFQVINPYTGKPCRATLVGYVDWKSNDLAGYEIMVNENTQCIASALRNAIIRLGRIPRIAYQDNGKGFKSKFFTGSPSLEEVGLEGLFARLGISPVFATPYNARAKIIERWFREFGNTFERLFPSYIGASIGDKPAYMMRNERWHKMLHNEYIPTIDETIGYIEMWLQWYRTTECSRVRGRTIGEVWAEGVGPGVDIDQLDDLMMETRIARVDRNGIRFCNQHYYDNSLQGMTGQVMIRYSLNDLDRIKVYSIEGESICTAERVMPVHPMASLMGTPKDVAELRRGISEQRSAMKQTVQGAKKLVHLNTAAALDWQRVAESAPRVIDQIEREGIALPATTESIPDECVIEHGTPAQIVRLEPNARPQFGDNVERYEWHLTHGVLNDEDEAFCMYFRTTNEFRMLYNERMKEAQ